MEPKNYLVTCLKCKDSSRLSILNNQQVMYKDHTPIIASRLRGDMQWGFECMCGNDSRLAREEKDQAEVLVSGGGKSAIAIITKSLLVKDEDKFKMELT